MTKPAWPRHVPKSPVGRTDPAPALLLQIATGIGARAAEVLRGRASASYDRPLLGAWSPAENGSAQSWHSDMGDGIDVWCALDGGAAQALLAIVLGGPGAATPTSLERGIVRETIERLLMSGDRMWEERAVARFPAGAGWLCRLTITARRGTRANLTLFASAAEEPPASVATRVDVRNVPVTLTATIQPVDVRVDAIRAWRSGSVVVLHCETAVVNLFAGAVRIASGSLGVARGRRAVRVDRTEAELLR